VVQPPQQQPGTQQPKVVQPPQQPGTQQPKVVQPPQQPGTQQPKVVQPPQRPGLPQQPQVSQPNGAPPNARFGQPKQGPGPRFGNVNELKGKRQQTRDKSGRVVIIEPGNRRIVRDKNRIVIFHDDSARLRRFGNAKYEVRGQERYTIVRRGDFEIVTITDANGRLLRRFRRGPDGREHVLIDNRRRGIRPGVAAGVAGLAILGLAAPVITMPRERYIVRGAGAPPALIYEALDAPPVAALERGYTLDEIRDNYELRAYVRSVDVDSINFESGSWELIPDQIPQLQALADAMLKVISEKPDTVFMIEGHTDAVGAPEDNLSLSDRRAETVSEILTSEFQVPPENMVTQGYGEQYLLVNTQGPSRENRRVQIRNITTLLAGK
jgi:outer membrane protein OmpA-like peptidoglycan-associated protein